jgi:hypothetical protein
MYWRRERELAGTMQKYPIRMKWTMWVSALATPILVVFVAAGCNGAS